MKDQTFWFLARASGFTAYLLITASMLAGLVLKSRPFGAKLKAPIALDVHRFITTLALAAIGVHGLALVADHTVEITLGDLVIPFTAPYKPLWTGLGVIAFDLALIVAISFPLKKRIGGRNWRRLHWVTYSIFAFSTVHGLMAGTDTSQPWAMNIYLGAVGAVAFATAWRAFARPARPAIPAAAPAGAPAPAPPPGAAPAPARQPAAAPAPPPPPPAPAPAPAPPPPAPAPAPAPAPPPPPPPPSPRSAPIPVPHPLRTSTSISTRIQQPARKE
jgi:DMSO/TMAO reductase YedYZ heme-binding membrane subunit